MPFFARFTPLISNHIIAFTGLCFHQWHFRTWRNADDDCKCTETHSTLWPTSEKRPWIRKIKVLNFDEWTKWHQSKHVRTPKFWIRGKLGKVGHLEFLIKVVGKIISFLLFYDLVKFKLRLWKCFKSKSCETFFPMKGNSKSFQMSPFDKLSLMKWAQNIDFCMKW